MSRDDESQSPFSFEVNLFFRIGRILGCEIATDTVKSVPTRLSLETIEQNSQKEKKI